MTTTVEKDQYDLKQEKDRFAIEQGLSMKLFTDFLTRH